MPRLSERKLIELSSDHFQWITEQSRTLHISASEVIRRCINLGMEHWTTAPTSSINDWTDEDILQIHYENLKKAAELEPRIRRQEMKDRYEILLSTLTELSEERKGILIEKAEQILQDFLNKEKPNGNN